MGDERPAEHTSRRPPGDAGHLDEDAEALEDPVHSGEARHQHELHDHEQAEGRRDEDDEPR
jgi:hypothetical protein